MTAKNVNTVTNIAGIIFLALSLYEYFTDKDMYFIVSFLIIGLIGISIKNAMILRLLDKYLNNKIDGNK